MSGLLFGNFDVLSGSRVEFSWDLVHNLVRVRPSGCTIE